MAEGSDPVRRREALDTPLESRQPLVRRPRVDPERFGRWSEGFARFMGTPRFLLYLSLFVVVWLLFNTYAPAALQFDPRSKNYTLLTLILSLQASYAAPLILLAQNRQDDRDRVGLEQDRQRAERNLADTEYLAREVAALRIALGEVATRDFLRSELRALLDDLESARPDTGRDGGGGSRDGSGKEGKRDRTSGKRRREGRDDGRRDSRDSGGTTSSEGLHPGRPAPMEPRDHSPGGQRSVPAPALGRPDVPEGPAPPSPG